MRLLIVNLHLDIGGVETLLVRLIPLLNKAGIHVTLLVLQKKINQEFLDAISPFCTVKCLDDAFPFTRGHLRDFFGGEFDVAFYTISQALVIGSWLLHRAGYNKTKSVLGAYQTEIFCAESEGWRYHRTLVHRLVTQVIPPQSIIFGNTAGRDFHADRLKKNFDQSPVIRLFVDIEKYSFKDKHGIERKKIVSIGRITEYKTYNFTVLPVIRELVDMGHEAEWHVYGDGDQFDAFKRAVSENGLEGRVFAHGKLNYSRFQEVLDDAFLFIGSGTSLIEAAACGVPALTTIEYAADASSYGYISEIEGFNMIEPGLGKKTFDIKSKVLDLLLASPEAYVNEQQACYRKAEQYSGTSIIHEYVSVFEQSARAGTAVKLSSLQICAYGISATLGFIANKLKRMRARPATVPGTGTPANNR
jgi:glycosyltransferase involved in cell wall biosynthesis